LSGWNVPAGKGRKNEAESIKPLDKSERVTARVGVEGEPSVNEVPLLLLACAGEGYSGEGAEKKLIRRIGVSDPPLLWKPPDTADD
jgi:hypothetical protein